VERSKPMSLPHSVVFIGFKDQATASWNTLHVTCRVEPSVNNRGTGIALADAAGSPDHAGPALRPFLHQAGIDRLVIAPRSVQLGPVFSC
jgi:hypothetical protein